MRPLIWMTLFDEADSAVRRQVKPIVKVATPILRAITRVFGIILWPLEQLIAKV